MMIFLFLLSFDLNAQSLVPIEKFKCEGKEFHRHTGKEPIYYLEAPAIQTGQIYMSCLRGFLPDPKTGEMIQDRRIPACGKGYCNEDNFISVRPTNKIDEFKVGIESAYIDYSSDYLDPKTKTKQFGATLMHGKNSNTFSVAPSGNKSDPKAEEPIRTQSQPAPTVTKPKAVQEPKTVPASTPHSSASETNATLETNKPKSARSSGNQICMASPPDTPKDYPYKTRLELVGYFHEYRKSCETHTDDNYRTKYNHLIYRAAVSYELPETMLSCLIFRESQFNPSAQSPTGAAGLGQQTYSGFARFYKELLPTSTWFKNRFNDYLNKINKSNFKPLTVSEFSDKKATLIAKQQPDIAIGITAALLTDNIKNYLMKYAIEAKFPKSQWEKYKNIDLTEQLQLFTTEEKQNIYLAAILAYNRGIKPVMDEIKRGIPVNKWTNSLLVSKYINAEGRGHLRSISRCALNQKGANYIKSSDIIPSMGPDGSKSGCGSCELPNECEHLCMVKPGSTKPSSKQSKGAE